MAEGLSLVEKNDEHVGEAELHRLHGELLLVQPGASLAAAEESFERAIEVAKKQGARSYELRASTSLARFWQSQNKCHEAYQLLAPIYEWFTEGFDNEDLKEAKTLLMKLGAEPKR